MQLNDLERAVLEQLLTGDHRALPFLRAQLEQATVASREFTGVGFITRLALPDDVPPAPLGREHVAFDGGPGDTVGVEFKGLVNGAGFVAFIDRGRLAVLEGFTYDEDWPPDGTPWLVRRVPITRLPPEAGGLD